MYVKNWGKTENKAIRRSFMLAKLGTEENLQKAIQNGEVTVTIDESGVEWYSSTECSTGEERGKAVGGKGSEASSLSKSAYKEMKDALESLQWNFAVPKEEEAKMHKGELPSTALEKVLEAKKAVQSVLKTSSTVIPKLKELSGNASAQPLFTALQDLSKSKGTHTSPIKAKIT